MKILHAETATLPHEEEMVVVEPPEDSLQDSHKTAGCTLHLW